MVEIRPAGAHEMPQLGLLGAYFYAGSYGDGPDSLVATANRPEWTLCAFDGADMVASFCTIPFTMRAAGQAVPLGGVTAVGTIPEYRRQGLLRRLMTRGFEDMYRAGRPVAALWASQAAIYQRYQFAMASLRRQYVIDSVDIHFHEDPGPQTRVARTPPETGFEQARDVYRQFVDDRLGYLHRSRALWQNNVFNDDAGPVHLAIASDSDGTPKGYVAYTLRPGHSHPARGQIIVIRDLAWLDPDTCRDLWRFIASHDLVGKIQWDRAPADDPAPELLSEPRLLNARDREGWWFRIVDVAGALTGRSYFDEGQVIIGTEDSLAPWNTGNWRLRVAAGQAEVARSDSPPDLVMSPKTLASVYTGYRSVRQMAAWGFIAGDDESIWRADRLFATPHAPHCPDSF